MPALPDSFKEARIDPERRIFFQQPFGAISDWVQLTVAKWSECAGSAREDLGNSLGGCDACSSTPAKPGESALTDNTKVKVLA